MAYGMITDEFLSANYRKFVNNTSDAGRELVVRIHRDGTALTHENLSAAYAQLTQTGGDGTGFDQNGPDAGTFAALGTANETPFVSGTSTEVFVRLQTTGTPNTADIVIAGANDIEFVVVATFAPRF
jgi:hypothetical protein